MQGLHISSLEATNSAGCRIVEEAVVAPRLVLLVTHRKWLCVTNRTYLSHALQY